MRKQQSFSHYVTRNAVFLLIFTGINTVQTKEGYYILRSKSSKKNHWKYYAVV
jgi:hypothetical protein